MNQWTRRRSLILELFIVANLAFLALDIFIAHSANEFSHVAEWIPFYFSIGAPLLLVMELWWNRHGGPHRHRWIGFTVGVCSSVVGIAGFLWHLNGSFFEHQTLQNLVYAAPFAAPLAYTGLGCLLMMTRMVKQDELEWSQWLIFFGLMGFAGNFVLALSDHAQNGFFHPTEWIPVVSSAIAVGFLGTALISQCSHRFVETCWAIMVVQVFVGVLGFYFHGVSISQSSGSGFFENLVYAAPVFAPLLFVNLAFLSGLGLFGVRHNCTRSSEFRLQES